MAVNGIPLLVMKELLGNIQCGLRIGAAHERGRADLAGLMLHLFYVRRTSCVNIREWDDAFQRRVRPKQHLDHRGITYESQRCNQHLLYGGDAISADELLSKNTDVAECRFAVIARKFLDGDYAGAAAFLEQTYDWDAAQKHAGYWELTAQLPHGELTMLEACYERLNDENGIKQLYEYYVAHSDSVADERCIPILKSMVGKSGWPQSVQNILRNYHEHDFGGKVLARLMTEERLSDEALALAGQRPELLRDLLKPISLNHSAEAERLIRKQLPLDRDLQQGNRNESLHFSPEQAILPHQ